MSGKVEIGVAEPPCASSNRYVVAFRRDAVALRGTFARRQPCQAEVNAAILIVRHYFDCLNQARTEKEPSVKNPRLWGKPLLILHLLFCCLWLYMFETRQEPADWMVLLVLWTIVGIQFTWGFTVGLIVGPGRAKRANLWWSLLLSFLPLYWFYHLSLLVGDAFGAFWGGMYFLTFVAIVASETFCGVLLGAKAHVGILGE